MAQLGGGKLNLYPCTPEDEQYNLSVLSTFVTDVTNVITGGGDDSGKVYVSTNDTTWNFLYNKMTTTATRDTNADPLIAFAIGSPAGNETLTGFLDASIITNGSSIGAGLWVLAVDNGNVKWYDASAFSGGGGADVLVKTSGTDAAGEYLSLKMEDYTGASPAYATGDLLIQCDLTNSGGAENLRYYAPTTQFIDYSPAGTWALCIVDNVWTWIDISNGVTYTEGYAIDISGGAIAFDHTEIDGWSDGELLGKSGSTLTFGNLGVDLTSSTGAVTISITFDATEIATDTVQVDTYKLLVSSSDTTEDYLYPKFYDPDTYSETDHQLVYVQKIAGSDEKIRLFTDRADTAAENTVELITFIYHSSINAANAISGPAVLPTELTVETMTMNSSTGRLEPSGTTTLVEYREGKTLSAPPTGYVYMGEALRIGSNNPVVLAIYCHQFSEDGA